MIDLINKIVSHLCYRCDEDEYMRGIKHDCNTCLLSEVIDEMKSINNRPHGNTKVKGDVIYRCDALEEMAQSECGCHYEKCIEDECKCSYIGRIKDIPSTNRPMGEWINKGDYAECSICGAHSGIQFDGVEPVPLKTKFCHNCGAEMKIPLYVYASWDRSEE